MSPSVDAAGPPDVTKRALLATFVRAFAIQGSWNYRSMLGHGFGVALLPILRRLYRDEELEEALERHLTHFNAHPYLANVALGAVARMEADRAAPEDVERFKQAVGGPLGGLGDRVFWVTLLPSTMVVALVLAWLGAPPLAAVLAFLVLYNAGHLLARIWGFRAGWEEGRQVASGLREAGLPTIAEALTRLGAFGTGVLLALVATSGPEWGGGFLWPALTMGAVVLGLVAGARIWRPTALVVVASVVFTTLSTLVS